MPEKRRQAVSYLKHLLGIDERRRQKRHTRRIQVWVRGLDIQGDAFEEDTKTIDISLGGACFSLKRNVWVGSTLELSLSLPENNIYETEARVKRVTKDNESRAYRIAVAFEGGRWRF